MKTKVYVGMSGGVDSSLSAALLVEQGYDVIGVYMKNWTISMPGAQCPWAEDLADAKRVAVHLGIDFKVFDFETEYKQRVVDYMLDEYRAGHTPNPDVMCNQEVKFKLFLKLALEDGADMIATGHYARVRYGEGSDSGKLVFKKHLQPKYDQPSGVLSHLVRSRSEKTSLLKSPYTSNGPISMPTPRGLLLRARDENKDQTYFLYRVTSEALGRTIFPVGDFTKPEVRKMATERGLWTAAKKDSQGICFVGQVGIKEFLSEYVKPKPGKIIDQNSGQTLGYHDGAIFYTIGQRHGLDLGGGLPYYVVGKDMAKNEVYVTTNLNDGNLWQKRIKLVNIHWINSVPPDGKYLARVRHRASLVEVSLSGQTDDFYEVDFDDAQKAIAPGQSVVIYDDQVCLGGGIVV